METNSKRFYMEYSVKEHDLNDKRSSLFYFTSTEKQKELGDISLKISKEVLVNTAALSPLTFIQMYFDKEMNLIRIVVSLDSCEQIPILDGEIDFLIKGLSKIDFSE